MRLIYQTRVAKKSTPRHRGLNYLLLFTLLLFLSLSSFGQNTGTPIGAPMGAGDDTALQMYVGGVAFGSRTPENYDWYNIANPQGRGGQYPANISFNRIDIANPAGASIPAEYSFYLRYQGDRQEYLYFHNGSIGEVLSTTAVSATRSLSNFSPGDWVIAKNAGRYKGQEIDVKISIVKGYAPNGTTEDSRIGVRSFYIPNRNTTAGRENFLYMYNAMLSRQRIQVVYEFFKAGAITRNNWTQNHEADRIEVAGNWNVLRINHYKSVSVESPKAVYYVKQRDGTTADPYRYYVMYFKQPTIDGKLVPNILYFGNTTSGDDDDTKISYTFNERDRVYMYVNWNQSTTGFLRYDGTGFMRIVLGKASLTGNESDYTVGASYDINQLIPPMAENQTNNNAYKYQNLQIKAAISNYFASYTYTVKNSEGVDISSYFTVNKANNELTLTANTSGGFLISNLYDQEIRISIVGKFDESKKDGAQGWGQYIVGDYIKLPIDAGTVSSVADGNVYNTADNSTLATVYYTVPKADVKVMAYDINENITLSKLQQSETMPTFFVNLLDGAANNTFEAISVGTTVTNASLANVGFAGIMRVKVTNSRSSLSEIFDVPINIVDSKTVYRDGYAIRAVNFLDYNITAIPPLATNRIAFVKNSSHTNVKAWNMNNGTDLTNTVDPSPRLNLVSSPNFFVDNSNLSSINKT